MRLILCLACLAWTLATSSVGAIEPVSYIQYTSQAGDLVGQGNTGIATSSGGNFTTRVVDGAVVLMWTPAGSVGPVYTRYWVLTLKAPGGSPLAVGAYPDASTAPGHPYLFFAIDNRACMAGGTGRFTVLELEFGSDGSVQKLAVDFEQQCNGSTGGLSGKARFNSTYVSLYPVDGPVIPVPRGTTLGGLSMQVRGDSPASGVHVSFRVVDCGALVGGSVVDVISDSNGMVSVPAFIAPDASVHCDVAATIPGSISELRLTYVAYAVSDVVITPPATPITVDAGQSFRVGFRVAIQGIVGSKIPVTFSQVPISGGAGAAAVVSATTTDEYGMAYADVTAGTVGGTYSIVATSLGASQGATVIQPRLVGQVATFFQYLSQPGDFVGAGRQETFTPVEGSFEVHASPSSLALIYQTPGQARYWRFGINAPDGALLNVGTYENAERSSSPTTPRLQVTGDGRACNVLFGKFTVLELERGPGDTVIRAAVDFEQHCEGIEPALYGGLRYNTDIPYTPSPPVPVEPAFIRVASQTGDWIGLGETRTLTRADGAWHLRKAPYGGGVIVSLGDWDFEFAPVYGQVFGVGTYEDAQGFPGTPTGHPGIDASGPGRGCSGVGRFEVRELEYGPADSLKKVAIDYQQRCSDSPAWLYGAIRYNSWLPYSQPEFPVIATQLRIAGDYTLFGVRRGGVLSGVQVLTLDASGNRFAGANVLFDSGSCGGFSGLWTAQAISDSNGVATMPPFSVDGYSAICSVTARLVGMSSPGVTFRIAVFDPAELALAPLPGDPLITVAGQPFRVGVRVTFRGFALGAMRATFSADGSSPAGVSELASQATTDRDGNAYSNAIANNEGGTYSIVAFVEGAMRRITVNQAGTAVASPFQVPPRAQGMWWSPLENGWGMSLVQHDDRLFAVIYAYDDSGKPTWYVMPTGTWNANFTRYAGDLYSPRGTSFFQYDATQFAPGLSFGSMAITFDNPVNPVNAAVEYSIGGMTGHKLLVPQNFGPDASAVMGPRTDMWWGGANQNGWGVAILQQGDTLFNVWFTYDQTGSPTWFVMPGGHWTSTDIYEGSIYRTLGSPWVGRGYDASQLKVFEAGPYRLRFDGDNATLDYSVDGRAGSLRLDKQPF